MSTCSLDTRIKNAIIRTASNMLTETGQFERVDQSSVRVIDENSDYEVSVMNVNNSFGEQVVKKQEELQYTIEPSDNLINTYLEEYPKQEELSPVNTQEEKYKSLDQDYILSKLEMTKENTLQDFVNKYNINSDKIKDVKFDFTESDSVYDSSNNTIYISLREMYNIHLNTGIPLKEVMNIYIAHEYVHSKSVFALQNAKNREYLNTLFEKTKEYHKQNPFEDTLRYGLNNGAIPYSLSSLEEFVADTFSNPYFQEWLQSIPEEKTLWDSIIDFLRELFGFGTKSNTYNRVINFVNSEKFQRENIDVKIRNLNEGVSTYKGNPAITPTEDDFNKDDKPKDYISATLEFFTQDVIKEDLLNFMNKLPYQMSQLRKRLNTEKDKTSRERIQKLLEAYGEVKGNEQVIPVYINMFISAAKVANDLKDLQLQAEKETDNNKKIELLYNLQKTAENLSDIAQITSEVLNILEGQPYLSSIQPFIRDLNTITSIASRIKRTLSSTMSPAVIQWFYSQNPDTKEYKRIQEEIQAIKEKPDYSKNQKYYDERIRRKEQELEKLPIPETFKKIFAGKYQDASIIQMQLEAIHFNSHPIIYTLASNLKEMDVKSAQEMQRMANDFTTKFEKYIKDNNITSLRDQDKLWSKFRQPVSYISKIEENEDGTLNIKEETTDMLVSQYSPEYLSKFLYFQAYNDFYYDEFLKANRDKDEEKANKYQNLYLENKKERQKFEEENSNRKYKNEVYAMYALLDKEITKEIDGNTVITSLRKERGDLFEEINRLEHIRDTAGSLEEQKHYQDLIQQKYIELNELKSEYDKYGNQKTGYDLEVSKILKEYSELKRKYGVYELTEMGQASFERDMLDIEKRFSEGRISKEQRDDLLSQMTKTQPVQAYYDIKDQIDEVLNQALDKITSIPELEPYYSKETKEKTKETYKKIRTLVAGFRDSEGTIDGQLFSNTRPELVSLIKELQQAQEDIKNATEKAISLSIEESIRLSELYGRSKKKIITEEEKIELTSLKKKLEEKRKVAEKYKVELQTLSDAFKQIGLIDETKNSEYYTDELNNQKNILKSTLKIQVENEISSKLLSDGDQILMEGRFVKEEGVWYENIKQKKKTVKPPIIGNDLYSPEEIIVDRIVNERLDTEIENTEWFNTNHYIKYVWNKKAKTYLPIKTPIYIWAETKPKDENMLEKKPSLKYLTYRIKDGREGEENFYNEDFSEIKNYIPSPKKGKFENPAYSTLNNPEKTFLEELRTFYKMAQEWYPSENTNGDILPGIMRTNEELRVETTNNLLKTSTYSNIFKVGISDEQDDDSAFLLGGSQKKATELPIRFTSKLPSSKISKNIPGMILTFAQHAKKYDNLKPQQALYENIREVVANLEVSESLNLAKSFSIRNLFGAGENNAKRISKSKDVDKTNLSKTVDYILDTYFYGQRKTASVIETPYGNIDMQKVGTGLKKLSSYSIFTLNMFNAVKNTFSAKIQQAINTNKAEGFYSDRELAKAQLRAMSYVKDYVQDYKKFGNKSFIGRAIDYFTVLQGAIHDEYGRKTQWTELKDVPNKLTILKNISEFELQITQFLAMSEANKVEYNGKMISFIDAFEIRNNQFELKQGVNISEKDIQRFINKIHLANRYINGAYREDERNGIQKTVLGDLTMYLNGYFFPAFRNRFGSGQYSYESESMQRGYWNETYQFIKDVVVYRRNVFARWKDMNQDERARVLSFIKELTYIAALSILIMLMGGEEDKKDLQKRNNLNLFLLATAIAVKSETESFVPFPGMGFNEIARKLNSPFAAMRQITNLIKLSDNFVKFVAMSDDAYYKQTSIKDGFHDKGDPKFIANFLKLLGWSGTAFDPLEKVTQVKAQQNLR